LPVGKVCEHEVGHQLMGLQPHIRRFSPDVGGARSGPWRKVFPVKHFELEAEKAESRQILEARRNIIE
jgi:hypothetical protein